MLLGLTPVSAPVRGCGGVTTATNGGERPRWVANGRSVNKVPAPTHGADTRRRHAAPTRGADTRRRHAAPTLGAVKLAPTHLNDPHSGIPNSLFGSLTYLHMSDKLPDLEQLNWSKSAEVEYHQQLCYETVEYPIPHTSRNKTTALFPTKGSSQWFKEAFHGFVSGARCTVAGPTPDLANNFIESERVELIAALSGSSLDGSMHPRKVCISLVVPGFSTHNRDAVHLIDAIFAWSVSTWESVPISTKARFTVYVGDCAQPLMQLLHKCAYCGGIDGIGVVLRWSELDSDGNGVVRAEFVKAPTLPAEEDAINTLQSMVNNIAFKHGVNLPGCLYLPKSVDVIGGYEDVVKITSEKFNLIVHVEEKFQASDKMAECNHNRLVMLPGVYVRLFPRAMGIAGALADTAMHAYLLCADGYTEDAQKYLRQHKNCLVREEETIFADLCLHTCGTSVETTQLGGMVSLYSHHGMPGQPISPPQTQVFSLRTAIVPLSLLLNEWDVYPCTAKSIIPKAVVLGTGMMAHMKRGDRFFNKTFHGKNLGSGNNTSIQRDTIAIQEELIGSNEDFLRSKFYLIAMGVDLRSNKTTLGDAIERLVEGGAPKNLANVLVSASLKIGLGASLDDAFGRCLQSLAMEDVANEDHGRELSRQKRITEAALTIAFKKKALPTDSSTNMQKVRAMLKFHALVQGVSKVVISDMSDIDCASSMFDTIWESYHRGHSTFQDGLLRQTIASAITKHESVIVAVAKGLCTCRTCDVPDGNLDAFILVHGNGVGGVIVYKASNNDAEPSRIGEVFESDKPAVITLKMKHDGTSLLTSVVAGPRPRA